MATNQCMYSNILQNCWCSVQSYHQHSLFTTVQQRNKVVIFIPLQHYLIGFWSHVFVRTYINAQSFSAKSNNRAEIIKWKSREPSKCIGLHRYSVNAFPFLVSNGFSDSTQEKHRGNTQQHDGMSWQSGQHGMKLLSLLHRLIPNQACVQQHVFIYCYVDSIYILHEHGWRWISVNWRNCLFDCAVLFLWLCSCEWNPF